MNTQTDHLAVSVYPTFKRIFSVAESESYQYIISVSHETMLHR